MNAQRQLQELGMNKDMTPEEKMKRRQEIQQEIANLNQQLRQHQIEKCKEQQAQTAQNAAAKEDNKNSQKTKRAQQNAGLSQASMQAMISADSSIKQAKVQGSAATQMEGRTGVLKIEIQLDAARSGDTSAKQAEFAKTEQRAESAQNAQLNTLAEANQTIEEVAKANTESKTNAADTDNRTQRKDDDKKKTDKISEKDKENANHIDNAQSTGISVVSENTKTRTEKPAVTKKYVDIYL